MRLADAGRVGPAYSAATNRVGRGHVPGGYACNRFAEGFRSYR